MDKFWEEILDKDAIIIDGYCYHDEGERTLPYYGFLGFDGRRFNIQMNDGRKFTTNNLWSNGKIPEEYGIKDNAVFIK